MKNRINLTNFNIRTDLIIDNNSLANYQTTKKINENITISNIIVDKKISTILQRKEGIYITIEFQDITNHEDQQEIEKVLEQELKNLLKDMNISSDDECLIVGLGNRNSTADSLGPITLDNVLITRHLFLLNTNIKKGIRSVAGISPGVMANTGIETSDVIKSVINNTNPKFLIVIDALASSSISRINKTIQITNTGIHPGSGIGNNRKEISIDTVGIPVIAIGVPTVVDSSIIVNDTIDYLFKHLSYLKKHYQENKLIFGRDAKKYLKSIEKEELTEQEREKISGMLGSISENEKKELIWEVLNSTGYNMIVTPKEIDFLIEKLGLVIARAINHSLHKEVND